MVPSGAKFHQVETPSMQRRLTPQWLKKSQVHPSKHPQHRASPSFHPRNLAVETLANEVSFTIAS